MDIKERTLIQPLANAVSYPLWAHRVRIKLISLGEWDSGTESEPLAQPKASNKALTFLYENISDIVMERFIHETLNAPALWSQLASKFQASNLSSQCIALASLVQFNYSCPTMAANEVALLNIRRSLNTAFKGETINIKTLVNIFGLQNLPKNYQNLRTTIEETTTDTNPLTFESLFLSLQREEASRATQDQPSSAFQAQQIKCEHGREETSCWNCHPENRPTCSSCKSAGFAQYRHQTGSRSCQRIKATAKKANRSVKFNVDSGATDTLSLIHI